MKKVFLFGQVFDLALSIPSLFEIDIQNYMEKWFGKKPAISVVAVDKKVIITVGGGFDSVGTKDELPEDVVNLILGDRGQRQFSFKGYLNVSLPKDDVYVDYKACAKEVGASRYKHIEIDVPSPQEFSLSLEY